MKKTLLAIIAALAMVACSQEQTITIENTLDFDRVGELVAVAGVDTVGEHALTDLVGQSVPYYLHGDTLFFQATVPALSKAIYTWKQGTATPAEAKVYCAFNPLRKDDFFWENDRAAYRMYGPALKPENPSNGVDLWYKAVETLVADSMYIREREMDMPYHIFRGQGCDWYKVGHAVGCGGLALVANDTAWVGGPYSSWKILEQSPLRCVFELHYDSIRVDSVVLQEDIRITVTAGSQLNKAEVRFTGDAIPDLMVGGGIFLHDTTYQFLQNEQDGCIAYAEPAISDGGVPAWYEKYNETLPEAPGECYTAVYLPNHTKQGFYCGSLLTLRDYTVGDSFTYYFGGDWSESGRSKNAKEWFAATAQSIQAINSPLVVTVK